jgi:IclR family acetate operon transcriptional repressor
MRTDVKPNREEHAEPNMLKTVTMAMQVLNILAEHLEGMTLSQLALSAGINKQAAFRLVKTLAKGHFVSTNPQSRKLALGSAILHLAARVQPQPDLRQLAIPTLTRLRDQTGETACLHVLFGDQRACVAQVESRDELRCVAKISQLPLIGAAGRVFLAFMPKQERARLLSKGWTALTPHTVTDRERVNRLLRSVRRDGFAVARDETVTGTAALSAPIRDSEGRVTAAITLLAPSSRLPLRRLLKHAPAVCDAAIEVSEALGYEMRAQKAA